MAPSATSIDDGRTYIWDAMAWSGLVASIVMAALTRIVFFTGFFGSDELTYTEVALAIANGQWDVSTYTGAVRYGVNLPNALFMTLFGASEYSANLWSLLCSVGEVALIFALAYRLWGRRAALLSAAVMIVLPLHVHFGGRLMADAPLAFFITLSFVLFWVAEKRQSAAWYFATGLAAGLAFWMKEVTVVYCVAFAIYALIYRTLRFKWLWIGLGGAMAVGANCLLFWAITGDPLHLFHVIRSHTAQYALHREQVQTSPWYYFRQLFVDIRHTWLMPFLAAAGVAVWARGAIRTRVMDRDTGYVVVWAIGLFIVFSFAITSTNPLTLIAKQTNYMLMFVAPFCLLAGYFLASMPRRWMLPVLGAYLIGGMILSGLEQQAIRVFTANSRATVAFARDHVDLPVYALTNGYRAGKYAEMLDRSGAGTPAVRSIAELFPELATTDGKGAPPGPKGYAVVDLQTIDWGWHDPIKKLSDVPPCWQRTLTLQPAPESGLGYRMAALMLSAAQRLPDALKARMVPPVEALVIPKPAYVFSVPASCEPSATPKDGG